MSTAQLKSKTNQSTRVLWIGILFSLGFTALIWLAGSRLDSIYLLPDQGPSWYYWKLPEPTFWTRLSVWLLYAAHQIAIWGVIYLAQKERPKYTSGLHRFNYWALGINATFIFLHFAQTHLFYDGLAQDVSIWSSQGSVILVLVMILLMENRRRGMFWGKKAPLSKEVISFVRRYHGYLFAWATIYTFWYHPMVNTSGHLIGFIYMFLLMLQGSLFFTRIHINKWWMLVQEVAVLFHGTLVAVMQGNGMWQMFAFGFGGIFVITQMHGLGWSQRTRLLMFAAYILLAFVVYWIIDIAMIHQITWIPIIEYLLVFVIAWIIGGAMWAAGKIRGDPRTEKNLSAA